MRKKTIRLRCSLETQRQVVYAARFVDSRAKPVRHWSKQVLWLLLFSLFFCVMPVNLMKYEGMKDPILTGTLCKNSIVGA